MRDSLLHIFGLIFTIALMAGCASDEAARYYASEKYPARPVSEVEIFTKKPEREFIVIADIQAFNASPEHMQRRAAEIGGDAVILVRGGGSYSRNEVWASEDRYATSSRRLLATVIKFK